MSEIAPSTGDLRHKVGPGKGNGLLVLVIIMALVAAGTWLVQRQKGHTDLKGSANTANTVQLSGDQTASAPVVGQPAPAFTATTMDGRKVSLASLKGHPVWLNFGATWCTACRAEAPDVEAAWKAHKAKGVVVLSVFISEDAATVQSYAQRLGLDFPMISDPDTTIASRYRSIGIPSHYFIDSTGVLRAQWVGGLTPEQITEDLARIGA